MCISSHCTIAEHAYGTCLNGYAHFSSLFLCAINVAIWGKLKSKRFEIEYIYPVKYFAAKKPHSWGQKLIGECELKKRLNFCKQYNIFTAFWDFIPKGRSWRIVDAVKDKKKEKKKDQDKNNKSKKKKKKEK